MNLSAPFIRRPVMTTLASLSAILFGISAYFRLPVSDLPDVTTPVITVTTNFPGASPDIMANNVATPLELQMMQIQGLELITSSNQEGSSTIVLQFALNITLDYAATQVEAAIQRASGNLPTELPAPPSFQLTNPNDQPIIYIALLTNTMTLGDLYDYANNMVAQRMMTLEGVSQAQVYSSPRAVRIKMNIDALTSRGLTVLDMQNAIQTGTVFLPAGAFYGENLQFNTVPQGQLYYAKDYEDLILFYTNNAPVRVRDVATPVDGIQQEYLYQTFWNRSLPDTSASLVVAITAAGGANAVQVSQRVRATLDALGGSLPASIQTFVVYDRSVQIVEGIDDVKLTILIAFILVILVVFIFLGRLRETVVPASAMPLAMLLTFSFMYMLGYSLDNLSLMALTLAVGFLIDDAIVVLENTVRHLELGSSPKDAALLGAKEISFTIFSMTLSLAAIFIPLVFMPGYLGKMFHEFAMTIVIAIVMSGVVAITLSPMICSRLLKRHSEEDKTRIERIVNDAFKTFCTHYKRWLEITMEHKLIAIAVWVASLVGTFVLFLHLPKSFLPVGDSSVIYGVILTAEGTSPEALQKRQRAIEQVLRSVPYVDQVIMVSGLQNSQLTTSMALIWVHIKHPGKRPPIDKASDELRMAIFQKVPGVIPLLRPYPTLNISTGATANLQGAYAYMLTSPEPGTLYRAAQTFYARLANTPGFDQVSMDMRLNMPQVRLDILRDQASSYGITAQQIEQTLAAAYSQGRAAQIKMPLNVYWVIIELADKLRMDPSQVEKIWIRNQENSLVPLLSVAKVSIETGPEAINHVNQITAVTIFYNVAPDFPIGTAQEKLTQIAQEVLPTNVAGAPAGQSNIFEQTVRAMVVLLFIAIFVMYVILGILYESYIHPITVLSTLPVAGVGGLFTLFLFNMPLDVYSFIGLFLLLGLVKKNGIMLVDFAILRRQEGMGIEAAAIEAAIERLRPILMTTFAAIFGALPMAFGFGADGASRQPLGLSVVGGLLVSQVLTLFVTPVIYYYMERFQEEVLDKITFFQRGSTKDELEAT